MHSAANEDEVRDIFEFSIESSNSYSLGSFRIAIPFLTDTYGDREFSRIYKYYFIERFSC